MRKRVWVLFLMVVLVGCTAGPGSQKHSHQDRAQTYAGAFGDPAYSEQTPQAGQGSAGSAPSGETSSVSSEQDRETIPGFGIALYIYAALGMVLLAYFFLLFRRRRRLKHT